MKKKQLLIWGILVFQYAISLAQSIPDYPIAQGVSAPFAGFIKDWLIVGGGCNFPLKPAAEGGEKVYYDQCYALNVQSECPQWIPLPSLPCPIAYGCAIETPEGLVCIGGANADSCLTRSSYRLSTKVYYPATSFPARDYRQRRGHPS